MENKLKMLAISKLKKKKQQLWRSLQAVLWDFWK